MGTPVGSGAALVCTVCMFHRLRVAGLALRSELNAPLLWTVTSDGLCIGVVLKLVDAVRSCETRERREERGVKSLIDGLSARSCLDARGVAPCLKMIGMAFESSSSRSVWSFCTISVKVGRFCGS